MNFVIYKLRFLLGNAIGFLLFIFVGKNILLKKINSNNIVSIYFHNPSLKVFEKIIKWLKKNEFNIISITEFQKSFSQKRCVSKRTVFISFDDAWLGNINLLHILDKYSVPIMLFVPTQALKDGDIWINIVRKNFKKIEKTEKLGLRIKDLKTIPNSKAVELYEIALTKSKVKRMIMSKEKLIKLSKWVSIGSHSVTHPILVNCTDDVIKYEMQKSYSILKSWQLNLHEVFAYPNGSYNTNVISIIKNSCYKYAFTTKPKIIELDTDNNSYTIPRICIPDHFGMYENLARMSGIWSRFFKNI